MDIAINTDINGYFSYRIFRKTPDNIIFESEVQKNLIVDTGLRHLYTLSIPEVMRVLDLGNSGDAASAEDTGLKGATFNNSNIFSDLSSIYLTGGPVEDTSYSEYTAFFRTKTTSSPTILKEFVIKPGPNQNAFARQVFDPITLQAGDGIEFYYKVKTQWQCEPANSTLKLFYNNTVEGDAKSFTDEQLPLLWSSVSSSVSDKFWTDIVAKNGIIVAVASASNQENATQSNIAFSLDNGVNWLSADTPINQSYTLDVPLNSVIWGETLNEAGGYTPSFVAVGLSAIYISETGTDWLSASVNENNNWTGVAYGKLSAGPAFVAVSNDGTKRVARATNVNNWTALTADVINSISWSAITYGKYFVAVADEGTHRIAYSSNGSTWLSAAAPAINKWTDIAYSYDKDLYVAVSREATYSPIMYASGGDMTKWYPARSPYSANWNSITYGNGLFVAVGSTDFQQQAIYSSDGVNWFPVRSIPSSYPWNAITYDQSTNTFTAVVSSNDVVEYPFANTTVKSRLGEYIDIAAEIGLIKIPDRVFNQNFIMYTLRDFDMPVSCSMTPETGADLQFSTTLSYNSYVKSSNTLISPNTAVSIYKFDSTKGHGAIKNLLITDTLYTSSYNVPGVWAIEIDASSAGITESSVYTGTLSSIVTVAPNAGSITRSISSTIGDIINNELQFNVYHVWGPNRPAGSGIVLNTNNNSALSSAVTDSRRYAIINIPNWVTIDSDDYSNKFYSDYLVASLAAYQSSGIIETGQMPCYGGDTIKLSNAMNFDIRIDNIQEGPVYGVNTTDVLASVYIDPYANNITYGGSDSIVNSLQTATPATSAITIDNANNVQVSAKTILDTVNASARLRGIERPLIEAVEILDGVATKLKLIFAEDCPYTASYVNVYNRAVDLVDDGGCLDENSNSIPAPIDTLITTRVEIIN